MLMAKAKIAQKFAQASLSYDQQAKVQQQIYGHLLDLLLPYQQQFQHILEIGCGTGGFSQYLQQHLHAQYWTFNDLVASHQGILQQKIAQNDRTFFRFGDAETLSFPQGYQLIASASALQWFSDPAAFLQKCAKLLDHNGYLLFNVFSSDNLTEIRQLTGLGLTYPPLCRWQQWLSRHFELLAWQQLKLPLFFDQPIAVLKHLKQTGVTATSHGKPWTKAQRQQFIEQYQQGFSTKDGRVSLTYSPLLFLARKKEKEQGA